MAALTVQVLRLSRSHSGALSTTVLCSSHPRHASTSTSTSSPVLKKQTSNLASYKRGRGGRSSFSGVVATVFGASGILGRSVTNQLGKIGSQVVCPYRGDPYHMRDLRLAGDLGQIFFVPFHLQDDESIRKSMKHSNVVINLIGRDWETKNFKFNDVNVDGAARIARIAKEMGVERLIHISHLGASPSPQSVFFPEGSGFLKSKYAGELAVKDAFPEATILRPSDMCGYSDRFLFYYCSTRRMTSDHRLCLWQKGETTIKMPVARADVAEAIMNAMLDPETQGRTYECAGPRAYYLSDIVDFMYEYLQVRTFKRSDLTPIFLARVAIANFLPNYPILNWEKLECEFVSDELQDLPSLVDLGVTPQVFEDYALHFIRSFMRKRYFIESEAKLARPLPPPFIKKTGLAI